MTMARARHSLSRALTRALLPWIAMLWVATSAAVGWYMQHELEEQLDAGLVESAERLLDLYKELVALCQREQQRLAAELIQLNQSQQGAKVYQLFT